MQVIAATFLIAGYLLSSALVFPLMLPALLAILTLMWWLNARRNKRVRGNSENYVGATTELHQRYEDWVAISRIASLGVDAGRLADRFEAGARRRLHTRSATAAPTRRHASATTPHLSPPSCSACRLPGG